MARALTVLAGTICLLCPWASSAVPSAAYAALLAGLALAILVVVRRPEPALVAVRLLLWLMAAAVAVGVVVVGGITGVGGASPVLVVATTVPALVLGVAVVLAPGRVPGWAYAVLAAAYVVLLCAFVATWDVPIDVERFVTDGQAALARGESPYAITIPDVYTAAEGARVYGPGLVEDGRVLVGYPYLPAALLLDLPAHLLGGAVWMHVAAVVLAVGLGWSRASDALGRSAVVVLALAPAVPVVTASHYVDALVVGLLALTWWALEGPRRGLLVVGLGTLFAAKQYSAFFLPALWPVLRRAGWRVVVAAGVLGVVVVASVALMDLDAFYRSAVRFQAVQPLREDAVSVLPLLQSWSGELPTWLTSASPLVGVAVSGVVAWRTRPGPTAFALCVGLGLLATVVVAKQAFVNYYAVIGAALLLAGVSWPSDDPAQTREPSSQGSRGARGISRTR